MASVDVVTRDSATASGLSSYVDWSAVIAGSIAALAVSFVLLTFGAAVGLSAVSPWTSQSASVTSVSLGSAFWLLLVDIWAFLLAGYLAGRMRHRWADAKQTEVDFRDSSHGLLAWATAVTIAAIIGAMAASGSTQRTENPALALAVDKLLRSTDPARPRDVAGARDEISRLLVVNAASKDVMTSDRAYLASLVSARAGVDAAEGQRRVETVITDMKTVADRTRKVGIVVGFLLASVLLVGAAAAWYAAGVGGKHRDAGTVWDVFARQRRIA